MNKLKSALLVSSGVVAIGAVGGGIVSSVSALSGANSTSTRDAMRADGDADLANFLATKLKVAKSDVRSALEEFHSTQHEKMEAARTAKLKAALEAKTITQAQYEYIIAAFAKMDTTRDSLRTATTDTERESLGKEMKTQMDALQTWLKEQNLTAQKLGIEAGMHANGPRDGRGGPGNHMNGTSRR